MLMILLNVVIILRGSVSKFCPLQTHEPIISPHHYRKSISRYHLPNVSVRNILVQNSSSYDCHVTYCVSGYHQKTALCKTASGEEAVPVEISNEVEEIGDHAK